MLRKSGQQVRAQCGKKSSRIGTLWRQPTYKTKALPSEMAQKTPRPRNRERTKKLKKVWEAAAGQTRGREQTLNQTSVIFLKIVPQCCLVCVCRRCKDNGRDQHWGTTFGTMVFQMCIFRKLVLSGVGRHGPPFLFCSSATAACRNM